jgi:hypothetical protein
LSTPGTFLPFAALHHHGSCWRRVSGRATEIVETTFMTLTGSRLADVCENAQTSLTRSPTR